MRRQYRDIRFSAERLDRIRRANAIIEDYEQRGFSMSLRQLYYQMVARGVMENSDRMYAQLGADVADGRMAGLISWTSIEDRNRELKGLRSWASPREAVAQMRASYRTDKWAHQRFHPEVWVEKRALEGVVGAICARLEVNFLCLGGYNSASEQWRAGRRFVASIARGQVPIVFHLGDHDPSGIDMTRDNQERLSLFAGVPISVQRLALNMDQVRRFAPPPNPAKVTDSRFEAYRRLHGDESWEVDALPPEVLQDLIRDAILGVRDEAAWEAALADENADRAQLMDLEEML